MKRRPLWIALAVLGLAAAATFFFWQRGAVEDRQTGVETVEVVGAAGAAAEDGVVAELYFPGRGGWLHAERHEVPASDQAEAQIAALVETLIAGPRGAGLASPLPRDVTVKSVYLMDDEVVLDLASPERRPPPSGSQREMLTVYSLVNTVLLNTEGAERLVLLWNGQQPMTFAGHLYTARPLQANRHLVARGSVASDNSHDPASGQS